MAKCRECSHANRDGARFCTHCGTAIPAEAAPERPVQGNDDEALLELICWGVGRASHPKWSESRAGEKRIADLLRAAALAQRETGSAMTRGDLVARQALELLRREVAVAGVGGFSRDATGVVSGWGSIAAEQGYAAAVFRRSPRAPTLVPHSKDIAELLGASGAGDAS